MYLIYIVFLLKVLLVLSPIILRIGPRKIQNLEFKVPLKESLSIVRSDISYYDIGTTGKHEDDYYKFDGCNKVNNKVIDSLRFK